MQKDTAKDTAQKTYVKELRFEPLWGMHESYVSGRRRRWSVLQRQIVAKQEVLDLASADPDRAVPKKIAQLKDLP